MPIANTVATTKPQATQNTQSASATGSNPNAELGANAFMKLLVSELKNQDPLNPMESRDMIAQLAQLSSVERLDTINASLKALNSGMSDMSNNANVGLIDKRITADGSKVDLESAGAVALDYSLNTAADKVDVVIRNSEGTLVRTLTLADQTAGAHHITWDGKDDHGVRAATGAYTTQVNATDSKGNSVAYSQQISGLVSKISYQSGEAELIVNNSRIKLSNVLSISQ
jgi:flagellar basal-body rod modification protein FlgD